MAVVRSDNFTRPNQSGWGTASDGNAWTASGTQAIAANEGGIGTSSASTFSPLGAALSGADAEGLVRFSIGGSTDTAGIILRYTDGSNHWLFRYDGSGHMAAMVKVSGTYTTLSPSFTFTPSNGTFYWLRARCQGTTIEFRVWQDGTTEPSTWTETYTSSSHNVAGQSGLYGFGHSTNSVKFDTFSVDDLTGGTVSAGATISGHGSLSASAVEHVLAGATISGHGSLSAAPSNTIAAGATISGHGSLSASAVQHVRAGATIAGHGSLSTSTFAPGTGIGDITTSSVAVSWPNGTFGAGSGTETRIAYADASNSGWALGAWPLYGGGPITAIYEIDSGVLSTNQTSPDTTASDGHIHWLEQNSGGTVFSGSEDVQFSSVGHWTEQAPVGTPFRAYWQAIGNATDGNGMQWTMWVCVYPGDPGLIYFRFDLHNPSGSAKALASSDSLEIALLGGIQRDDNTWLPSSGGYGTLAGTDHVGWPVSLTTIEPDYVYIVPNPAIAGVHIGQATVKKTSLSGLGWSSLQTVYLDQTGSPDRLKIKVQGTFTSFPAGATQTVYLMGVLRRNLTAADVRAMAAAYLHPGTPTTTVGTFSGWSDDEGAYVFAAGGGGSQLGATLDLSGTGVTALYKPVLKITGWTDTSAPLVSWGSAALVAGSDYRFVHDAANNVLYLQLYCDVVASGASAGQRNNAPLSLATAATSAGATLPGHGSLSVSAVQHVSGRATIAGHAALTASAVQHVSGHATIAGHGALTASGVQHVVRGATIGGHGVLSAAAVQHILASVTLRGKGSLTASGNVAGQVHATIAGHGSLRASGVVHVLRGASITGHGSLTVSAVEHVSKGATIAGHGALTAAGHTQGAGSATLTGHGSLSVSAVQHILASVAIISGHGTLSATPVGVKPYHPPVASSTMLRTVGVPAGATTVRRELVGSTSKV